MNKHVYLRLHRTINEIHSSIVVKCPLRKVSDVHFPEGHETVIDYIEQNYNDFGCTSFEVFQSKPLDLNQLDGTIQA